MHPVHLSLMYLVTKASGYLENIVYCVVRKLGASISNLPSYVVSFFENIMIYQLLQ